MKKYDPTKSLKHMFHKPNVVPFYNIMLIIIVLYIALPIDWSICSHSSIMNIPPATNAHYEPKDYEMPSILIDKNGKIRTGFFEINDTSKLPDLIWELLDRLDRLQVYNKKILLKVDSRIKFGKVQEVLKAAKNADVNVVGLITQECVPLGHFFKPKKK
jgi:biopolymer transport protein ExbD